MLSLLLLIASLILLANFLNYNETRQGFAFEDPLLILFQPVDVTWLTFILVYGAVLAGIIYFLNKPELLVTAFFTYGFMVLFRIAAMYSLPLDPPASMIALKDPFVELFGGGTVLKKDLFFSGHTSTMFILFLVSRNKNIKRVFLILTIAIGVCVLLQHVHYTIDVIAAPFFTFAAFFISNKMKNYVKNFA
jgi:membrane-associated phospholipid phosphatase